MRSAVVALSVFFTAIAEASEPCAPPPCEESTCPFADYTTSCFTCGEQNNVWANCDWLPASTNYAGEIFLGVAASPDECIESAKTSGLGCEIAAFGTSSSTLPLADQIAQRGQCWCC